MAIAWGRADVLPMAPGHNNLDFIASDLAPGDSKALGLDRDGLQIHRIGSTQDPGFALAYEQLWNEFGLQHEMESAGVIGRRLSQHQATRIGSCWLSYEMILVQRHGQFVAVRDHTAIVRQEGVAIVHLSHVLIDPQWRRTGLAGWLRAWPIQTARTCLAAAGFSDSSPVTLAGEMEHPDPSLPHRLNRLIAYEKAGFKKVAPAFAPYLQPDFRSPAEIDASGGPRPLPFSLVLRRVGRETEGTMLGAELRKIVQSLYHMYESGFRPKDMAPLWSALCQYPSDEAVLPLVPPSA